MTASTILATGLTSVGQLQLVGQIYLHVFVCLLFVVFIFVFACFYTCLFLNLHLCQKKLAQEFLMVGRSVRGRTGWLTQTICSQTAPTHRFTPTFGGKSGPNGFLCGKVTLPFLADGLGNWNSHEMKLIEFSQSI